MQAKNKKKSSKKYEQIKQVELKWERDTERENYTFKTF